ncbi:MAG: MarR family winged helix-turn-helix transcriptional regulator [Veillonella caviae]|nr:MarR family winged helix-turn-helix transcriptional regulator [Veillonella caviae]
MERHSNVGENIELMAAFDTSIDQFKPLIETISVFSTYINELRKEFLKESIKTYIDSVPTDKASGILKKRFNHSEMQIISYIEANDDNTATYQELVQAMPFSQGMLSRYVKRLSTEGLVVKFHKSNDLKSILLRTTELGNSFALIHNELHKLEDKYYEDLLGSLPSEKVQHTLEVLEIILNSKRLLSPEDRGKLNSLAIPSKVR